MLDRYYQREILVAARNTYPDEFNVAEFSSERERLNFNLAYLAEHGLIIVSWFATMGDPRQADCITITAKGLDFLEDDGGLSAILGTVTVKIHEDSLKAILTEAVQKSKEPESVKTKLIAQIKALPAELTKQAVLDAAKTGLQQSPALAMMLGKYLGL